MFIGSRLWVMSSVTIWSWWWRISVNGPVERTTLTWVDRQLFWNLGGISSHSVRFDRIQDFQAVMRTFQPWTFTWDKLDGTNIGFTSWESSCNSCKERSILAISMTWVEAVQLAQVNCLIPLHSFILFLATRGLAQLCRPLQTWRTRPSHAPSWRFHLHTPCG